MMIFDVIIVGGGHSGLEAAWMASQFHELKVAIISMPGVPLASAPCNPAIGGVGKGQVVREIDALGGAMGILADQAAIQYRVLNSSKGYAVQSTRVQIDKEIYPINAEKLLSTRSNLFIYRHRVNQIRKNNEDLFEIKVDEDLIYLGRKVIMTTGTFLNGKLHSGESQIDGGRTGCTPSKGLSDIFSHIKVLPVRFKTGTPPRILNTNIDFSQMEEQHSDNEARNFHCLHHPFKRLRPQMSCFLTKTTEKTLEIIRNNKDRSPIFNGQIKGIGPRYCPSIEDKAYRYPERHSHHVFIEPEGLNVNTLYPNGISTSLPVDIQEQFIKTIPGLEKATIAIPGYAVEYDVVDTSQLNSCLEYVDIPGLYFAGQVNGTSGYEEAAGQGLVAGLNAALSVLKRPPIILSRHESYIGVMVEDLVSNCRDEPYRLFTARSENRLHIREDNVFIRMFPYRKEMLLSEDLDLFYDEFILEYEILSEICEKTIYVVSNPLSQQQLINRGIKLIGQQNLSLSEVLKQPELDPVKTLNDECQYFQLVFRPQVITAVAITKKYEGYILRADQQNKKIQKLDDIHIKWEEIFQSKNISYECRLRISQIRPETFGQLRLIEGIRPATLAIVAGKFY